jgi:hypothetical protein
MRVSLPTFVVMMLMTGFVRSAAATPISYSEAVSGDLTSPLPAPTVFALDVGANTVSGTSTYGPGDSLDFDSFAFSVPVGMMVTNISYAFVRGGTATAGSTGFVFGTGNIFTSNLGSQTVNLFGASPVVMFASGLPESAGIYGITNNLLSRSGDFWTDNYTWTLTVAPTATAVPEPVSLVLLGSGLIAAGARRLRTRRNAA